MKKMNLALSGRGLGGVKKRIAPLVRHMYFVFVIALLAGIGLCVYLLAESFNFDDNEYRAAKEAEFLRDVRIRRDDATVDKVLRLETAGSGPVQPDYVPSRDNPFKE